MPVAKTQPRAEPVPKTEPRAIPSPVTQMARFMESEEAVEEVADRQDLYKEPEPDAPENFEIDDYGRAVGEPESDGLIEFEVEPSPLPRLRDLPAKARPRVLFWIDADFRVHSLVRGAAGPYFEKAEAITRAIALHLQEVQPARLEFDGDWIMIPVIQSLERLKELLHTGLRDKAKTEDVIYWVRKRTGMLRSFAFHLPNGDTVTAQALLSPALKKGTRIGAAAVRRLTSQWHPSGHAPDLFSHSMTPESTMNLAGEVLTESEWNTLLKGFNKAAREHTRRGEQSE